VADLRTRYLGLDLANPLIAGSCSLHKTVDGVKRSADAGAGAVVLKSLFEEQLALEAESLTRESSGTGHTEAYEYLNTLAMRLGPRDYLRLIEEAKRSVSIPVIASLNCVTPLRWVEYASQIAAAGADALEVNAAFMPTAPSMDAKAIEDRYYKIVESIAENLTIPFAVKIGPYFSALPRFAAELVRRGARGLVLFNRFYQLDVDTRSLSLAPGYRFSSPEEIYLPLRWIAVLSGQLDCDLAGSTGVHDAEGVVKLLLAGAAAVQVCSALYLKQVSHLGTLTEGLKQWMKEHGFESLDQFRGKLRQEPGAQQEAYERLQYIKVFVGIE